MALTRETLLSSLALSSDVAFAVDERYYIVFWSAEAERVLGYPAGEVLGRPCYEVIRGRNSFGKLYCRLECEPVVRSLNRERCPTYDLHSRTRDGKDIWLNVSTFALWDELGCSCWTVHLARDITPQRRKQELAEKVIGLVGRALASGPEAGAQERPPAKTMPSIAFSRREMEVLRLLATGLTTAQIAAQLRIRRTTVAHYIQQIMRKIGVRRRSQAIAWAFRNNMV